MGKSTISMAIFNSYVKLPEGIEFYRWIFQSKPSSFGHPHWWKTHTSAWVFISHTFPSRGMLLKVSCFARKFDFGWFWDWMILRCLRAAFFFWQGTCMPSVLGPSGNLGFRQLIYEPHHYPRNISQPDSSIFQPWLLGISLNNYML